MKWYLVIGGIFLIGALGAVIYVWMLYQDAQRTFDAYTPSASSTAVTHIEKTSTEKNISTTTGSVTEDTKPITVDTATLTETQQNILKTFGYNSQTLIITSAMVVCAENAVGKDRLNEILKGSAPNPLETVKLFPCFKE